MKTKFFVSCSFFVVLLVMFLGVSFVYAGGTDPYGRDDQNRKVVKQGLLGAATGAISAEASGGKAGTGALVGAGTNVIGGALLDTLTQPSQPQPQYATQPQPYPQQQQPYPQQQQPAQGYAPQQQQPVYYQDPPRQPVYAQPAYPAYPQREDPNKKLLKQGLLGAGTGAIAASASGGKAGKGALIGAGTNILGGVLLDTLTQPSQPPPQQYYYPPQNQSGAAYPAQQQPTRRVIRKYDAEGNVISEEEVYE